MPIYAYKCESCGHAKDVLQKISDPVLSECPACGNATFKKQLTAAGFQLKGSGWYVTDFREGSKAKEEKKPETKSDTHADNKTDTKAAPAPAETSSVKPAPTDTSSSSPSIASITSSQQA